MKFYSYAKLAIGLSISLIIFYFYMLRQVNVPQSSEPVPVQIIENNNNDEVVQALQSSRSDIVVVVVACGDRLHGTLNMLKSALMFSKQKLNFIVIAEDDLIESFNEKLGEWQNFMNGAFTFKVLPLTFPEKDADEWRKLFKPCAAQRLFLPSLLKDVDSLLYMDTDTLFLTPVETVWEHFGRMNASQMAALAPEHEDPHVGWYNRFAKHPYYGELGVNSGVMLMNLTRMRTFKWEIYVVSIYKKYKLKITWGDQDIINIIFHYHPDKLYVYSCRYNFRPDHCMYMSICKLGERHGVAVVHGSRGFFHSQKQPVFQALYRAFEEFQLGGDLYRDFYQPLETSLDLVENRDCGHVKDIFLKNIRKYIDLDDNR